jgi:hypothetical protein
MTYAGGLNVRQFVKMLRHFSGAFVAAAKALRPVKPSALAS